MIVILRTGSVMMPVMVSLDPGGIRVYRMWISWMQALRIWNFVTGNCRIRKYVIRNLMIEKCRIGICGTRA